jgi:ribosome-associated toxin RatA of RatAB toxin-antitoxin module
MQTVRKSVIVARPAGAMFRLVDECERYPEFLPWCASAEVHDRTPESAHATLNIDYHGLRSSISTLNRMQAPHAIDLEFVDGPFHLFKGHWRFLPLGDEGCRVEFALDYAFTSHAMEKVLGPVFGHIVETLVDHFVERAESAPAA